MTALVEDRDRIVACVEHYFLAGDTNSSDELRRAFHPTAMMFSAAPGGGLAGVSQPAWWARLDAATAERKALARYVAWIDVEGDAAAARLRSDYDGFAFHDFVTLLRLDGRWQIVGKIFHRAEPAAAEPPSDREAVETAVRSKFRAMDASDPELLANVYHPRAMTYTAADGRLVAVSAEEWRARFAEARASGAARPAEREVLRVDVAGDAALAKLSHDYGGGERWVDYASLVRAAGGWRVVGLLYAERRSKE